jgi:hypothetical protein
MCTVDVQEIDRPFGESAKRLLACRANRRRTVGVPNIALRHGLASMLPRCIQAATFRTYGRLTSPHFNAAEDIAQGIWAAIQTSETEE